MPRRTGRVKAPAEGETRDANEKGRAGDAGAALRVQRKSGLR